MNKKGVLIIRMDQDKKDKWKKKCLERKISLTSLVIDSVEDRPKEDERRKIFMYLEEQGNFFVKIETNINQVARIANAQKSISDQVLKNFTLQVAEVKN